jgi:hypothetical protein
VTAERVVNEHIATRYVRFINDRRYDEMGTLFADNGVFISPVGRFEGAAAIGEFFSGHLRRREPTMGVERVAVQGRECWSEMTLQNKETGAFQLVSANHFTVDSDGRIERLCVFTRTPVEGE